MAKLSDVQNRLLDHIESEMDLIIQLRRKYNLGFKIYTRMRELLTQQEAILNHAYSLEQKSLGNNEMLVTATFEDSSCITYRRAIEKKVQIAE